MQYNNRHGKIRLVSVVIISMLVGLFASGTRTRAQSLSASPANASDSLAAAGTIAPDAESSTINTTDPPAIPGDAITANAIDDSAAPPMSDDSSVEDASPGNVPASDDASENNSVLELPRVIDPRNRAVVNAPIDEASMNPDDNDDTALSSQDGEDTDGDANLAAGSPVGTLADYQNQANEVPPGAIFFAPPVAIASLPRPPQFNTLPQPPFGPPIITPPIILPPTSSGPFPSTSPMLMGPRLGTFGLSPGRGLIGARR